MSITSILRDQPNNVSIVRIETTNTLAEVAAANYILSQADVISNLTKGFWQWFSTDMILIAASDGNGLFTFSVTTPPFTTIQQYGSAAGGGVNPGPLGRIPFYASAGDVVSPLTAVANSVLQTNNLGITSWSTLLPTGLDIPFYYPIVGAVDSGAANAYVLSTNAPDSYVASYFNNQIFWFSPANANSGASTVNVEGLGVKDIVNSDGTALSSGALILNASYMIIYSTALAAFELVNSSFQASGVTPSQIQNQTYTYFPDFGAANAYSITPSPTIVTYADGQSLWFKAAHANTSASTIDINAIGAVAIVGLNGAALTSGDILANYNYQITYSSLLSKWVLQNSSIATVTPAQIQKQTFNYVSGGGSANAYTANYSPAITSYTDGMMLVFKATQSNGNGGSTFNANSIGNISIKNPDGSDPSSGAIAANRIYAVTYNSSTGTFVLANNSLTYATATNIQDGTFVVSQNESGTANAYNIAISPNPTLSFGIIFSFVATNTNTSNSTLKINGSGIAPIYLNDGSNSTNIPAGSIVAGGFYTVAYYNNSWVILNPEITGGVTPVDIQNQAFTYSLDTGAANAYVIALSPVVASPLNGQTFTFLAAHANSGASTIDVGYGAVPLVNNDGSVLASNSIISSGTYEIVANNTYSGYVLQNPAVTGGIMPAQIQNSSFTFAPDSGVADAYVVAYTPVVTSGVDGQTLWFEPSNSNSGAPVTIDVGYGPTPLVNPDGSTLAANSVILGRFYEFYFNTNVGGYALVNPSISIAPADIQNQTFIYAIDSGTTNHYVITLSPPVVSIVDGQSFVFLAQSDNTASSTINVGPGIKAILNNDGSSLAAGAILNNGVYRITYDSNLGAYVLENSSLAGAGADFPTNTNITDMTGLTGTIAEPSGIASAAAEIMMSFNYIPSAVNGFGFQNAATGQPPTLYAAGSDTDITLELAAKGAGGIDVVADSFSFNDQLGNIILIGGATPSAVNFLAFGNNITGNAPSIQAQGSDTDITLNLIGSGTGGVEVQGVGDASNANAGYVGEYISQSILAGSAVSLTSTVAANIASVVLTPGDWDLCAQFNTLPAGGTVTALIVGGIGSVSANFPVAGSGNNIYAQYTVAVAGAAFGATIGQDRITVAPSTTKTVYLVVQANFSVSTMSAYGFIGARRVR